MVFFLTGVPGSGKTYYLVNYAEKNINKIDKKTNEKIYLQVVHNISGYKNGFYVDFGADYLPKIIKLNEYFLTVKKDINKDDLLIKKAEELGIYKILLIVDECHLYFVNDFTEKGKKQYYALLWFISYHCHLYVDLVLATQNLSLVDYKFKAFAEYFVKAVPSSMRFNINPFATAKFTYNYFPDSKMWNETKFKTDKIKAEKKIFELYTSGDAVKKQKVYLQTLLLIFGLAGLTALLWWLFQYTFTRNAKKVESPGTQATELTSSPSSPALPSSDIRSFSPDDPRASHKREKRIIDYTNEDMVFDVVTCSDTTGNCTSFLTPKRMHYYFFKNLISLKLVEKMHTEKQFGLVTYYVILHLSKKSYLEKFLIGSSSRSRADKRVKVNFNEITDQYKSMIKDK